MAGRYQCSEEEIKAIEQKRKGNKDKRGENSAWCKILCKRKSTKSGNGAMKSAQAAG